MIAGVLVATMRARAQAIAAQRQSLVRAAAASARALQLSQASRVASTQAATTRATTAVVVAAIWNVAGYNPYAHDDLVVGICADGTVIWSRDKAHGGPPYFTAKLEGSRVDQLLRDLDAGGFFALRQQIHVAPDAGYKVVAAILGEKRQFFGSWHDPPPADPNVIVTEQGMQALQPGQARPKASVEYQRFIDAWDRAKQLIEAAVPAEGEKIDQVDVAAFEKAFRQK
jgi:hypothetical protein